MYTYITVKHLTHKCPLTGFHCLWFLQLKQVCFTENKRHQTVSLVLYLLHMSFIVYIFCLIICSPLLSQHGHHSFPDCLLPVNCHNQLDLNETWASPQHTDHSHMFQCSACESRNWKIKSISTYLKNIATLILVIFSFQQSLVQFFFFGPKSLKVFILVQYTQTYHSQVAQQPQAEHNCCNECNHPDVQDTQQGKCQASPDATTHKWRVKKLFEGKVSRNWSATFWIHHS